MYPCPLTFATILYCYICGRHNSFWTPWQPYGLHQRYVDTRPDLWLKVSPNNLGWILMKFSLQLSDMIPYDSSLHLQHITTGALNRRVVILFLLENLLAICHYISQRYIVRILTLLLSHSLFIPSIVLNHQHRYASHFSHDGLLQLIYKLASTDFD